MFVSVRGFGFELSHGLCSRRGSPGTSNVFASRRGASTRGFRLGVVELP